MGLNKATDRYLIVPEGSVMTTGYSTQLAKGQIGLFDVETVGKYGATAIDSVAGFDKNFSKLEVRLGVEPKTARTLSDKDSKTLTFNLSDIKKAWVGKPHVTEQKFDEWYIGYNGMEDNTSFVFKPGESMKIDLVLWGKPLGYLNMDKGCNHVATYNFIIPENYDNCTDEDPCGAVDCKQFTLDAVKYFNEYSIPSGEKLSKYFYINPVLSPAEAPVLTEYTLWELDFCGFEGSGELGKVQAQYPGVEIVRDDLSLKFQMLIPTADGAPGDYSTTLPDLIPGCEGCPAGYDEVEGGFVYVVKLEDDGVDEVGVVEALTNAIVGTGVKLGQNYGTGYYTVLTTSKLTAVERQDFITINPTASVVLAGEKGAVCTNNDVEVFAWEEVTVANSTVKTFEIILQDDCNGSRLIELQEAYPDLVITAVATNPTPANCLRKYSTTVMTDIVFPNGCPNSDVIHNVYTAEAPTNFDFNSYWVEVVEDDAESYSCGIHIKAKPVIVNATGECLIDELPFIATSMRVKPAGGYITNTYLNSPIVNNPFSTLQVESAQDLDNLGGNMRSFERQGKFYFQNESYFSNVYARDVLGLQNSLDGLTQYTFHAFQVDRFKHVQGFGQYGLESIVYHMVTPVGQSSGVEAILNTLAAGAGVVVEQL